MSFSLKKVLPHVGMVLVFVVTSLVYFSPVLQGKRIYQSDIVQYLGMAREQTDFKNETGEEPYWVNNAFGGMPTFQLGANYPHNYIKKLDKLIRFLPRPADYLFLYFLGFYIFFLVLKNDYRLAALGALAFGFSTYLIIILGVGHNAKAHAIGYFPLVLAGIVLAFRQKYIWGFLLTTLAMALQISANHFQMTYYLLLLVLVLGVAYLIDSIRKGEVLHFAKTTGILAIAIVLSLVLNATGLMATKEYAAWSTRGETELTLLPDGSPRGDDNGLSKEYITEYSYGLAESLNLFIPGLFGGSNSENLGENSETYRFMVREGFSRAQAKQLSEGLPAYWGDQPIVAAPAYVGATVIFMFLLGVFLVKGRLKWWLLGGAILSLVLSWGKNFSIVTDFLIAYFPMYNKFRAVSSIQVILELCVPALAMAGLYRLMTDTGREQKEKALKTTVGIITAVCALLFVFKGSFSFEGVNDLYYRKNIFGDAIMDAIVEDRKALYTRDLLRSFILVLVTAGLLFAFLREKLRKNTLLLVLTVVVLFDLVGVARRYVNDDDFVQARILERPFSMNTADKEILRDTTVFRVYDPSDGMSGARAAFFHNSIGGYHAAKPGRFQELYDYQIARNNVSVLNMLNVKYVFQQDEKGNTYPAVNPYTNGNAWFVSSLIRAENADEEINALTDFDEKNQAVLRAGTVPETLFSTPLVKDSTASIKLTSYKPNHLVYKAHTAQNAFAVFSEIYYPKGWNAYLNGEKVPHVRANYVLRAMEVPKGQHTIEFRFEPQVVITGSRISLAGSVLFVLLTLGALYYEFKVRRNTISSE
ncbi:YfhO family protein [Ascidiimonas aurantiaca]|uniref:YfhO family protein n=1 Tax=Ascidiimonas aurantiaca TaxID=1685432 RepID=UPI0030EF948B